MFGLTRDRSRLDLAPAIRQTGEAAGERYLAVVAQRRDREHWRVTLPLADLLGLLGWTERG